MNSLNKIDIPFRSFANETNCVKEEKSQNKQAHRILAISLSALAFFSAAVAGYAATRMIALLPKVIVTTFVTSSVFSLMTGIASLILFRKKMVDACPLKEWAILIMNEAVENQWSYPDLQKAYKDDASRLFLFEDYMELWKKDWENLTTQAFFNKHEGLASLCETPSQREFVKTKVLTEIAQMGFLQAKDWVISLNISNLISDKNLAELTLNREACHCTSFASYIERNGTACPSNEQSKTVLIDLLHAHLKQAGAWKEPYWKLADELGLRERDLVVWAMGLETVGIYTKGRYLPQRLSKPTSNTSQKSLLIIRN